MVRIHAARTLPVNPPDAPFVLTRRQLWKALQRKIRHADEFVPAMKKCVVVKDSNDIVLRECLLETPSGETKTMTEEVTSHGEQFIIFRQLDGSVTTNLVSNGEDLGDRGLQLTYFFEWDHPDIQEGTPAYDEAVEQKNTIGLMAVKKSIETARQLVQDSVIDG
ncbi:DUF1857-domain-containing protein [Aspergillus campestris IBT 28561]|uniref:DUF1857-domain-containing protein n=1 Tax=Aspergillus campestris (strain IBT 28561) TaxID=1392248 RepID=A0A2I1DDF0_ASPC2|nr:DUF1857-domain-containing protein [Aspergillus campestris IBT 28561]PKY07908.1 DUF1857-domain-containing protein [Aspergillus campestris IBT 28561]